ncbi:hypothetical protein BOH66_01245 [Microbacterium aurum]|uniref:Transposase n=1 Tax=Microbacterium aurum TaxID=36805 RepID=A0A1P8U4N2_9MICO|nr:TnsA-like heteromeric transposase endonuclease subunit [Microbacterium aurum]APZ33076.1 hypothetical protein BOH66_01245 [Microbacterium aurum]MBM7826635.1 hypothetical protein [Microbacterium aurum]
MSETTPTTEYLNSATWLRGKKLTTAPLDSNLLDRELYDVDPVRRGAAYPRQRNYHGYFSMASTGEHVWHESLLERDCLMWLDWATDIVAISSQPMKLTTADGEVHYPDLLGLDANGTQTVYDVKPLARINEKARAQFAWTRDVCADIGWDYRVLTELPIQYKVNLTWFAQFRHHGHHPGAAEETSALEAFREGWTIHDAVRAMPAHSMARARSNVFHLLWTGALTCDMNARMSDRTLLHPRHTTRQEFPNALA